MSFALGIDLGGSSIKAVAVTPAGETLAQTTVPFVDERMEWAHKIRHIVEEMTEAARQASLAPQQVRMSNGPLTPSLSPSEGERVPKAGEGSGGPLAIGLSAPGLAARDGRSIAVMPGRLFGLEGLDWTEFLCAPHLPGSSRGDEAHSEKANEHQSLVTATATPTELRPVPVLNDAHAALLGEVWCGAARGLQNVFLLTLGTGVGGAAMVDGHLLRGAIGRAGHLGHTVIDWQGPPDTTNCPGSLEWAIGNHTIGERSAGRFATTHELVAAHLAGDAAATCVWLRSVRALACGIGSLVNVLDPEAVILGGGIARSGAALFEPLEKFLREVEWQPGGQRVKLLPATLGEFAGAYGAAYNALNSQP